MEGKDVEFTNEVLDMRLEVTVGNEVGLEVHEGVEVGFVITIVEGVGILCPNPLRSQ